MVGVRYKADTKLKEFAKSPNRSLILISLPIIASAIAETLYNIIDAVFVGRLGAEALAAITFAWPFFFVLVALSLGINSGISSRISRFIGEKKKKDAENTMWHGLLLALVLSIVVAAAGIPLLGFLFTISGATGDVLSMASSYMLVILLGIVFMFLSYAITSIFIAQGDTKTAMKIDIYSLLLNVILAPIFIFVLHMGIVGAALATVCSVVFALIQSLYYMNKVSYLRLNWRSFRFSMPILKEIIAVGFPTTLMMLTISFYVVFLNRAMVHFSVDHVAVFGIVSRLETIAVLPVYGISMGAMTLAGMFFGAKKFGLLEKISWTAIWVGVTISAAVGLVFLAIPRLLIMIFTSDPTVISIGTPYLMLDVITFPFMAINMVSSRIMQGIGLGLPGLVVNVIRVLVVAVPVAYLFVFVFGFNYLSIVYAMALGGLAASIAGLIWLKVELNKCKG